MHTVIIGNGILALTTAFRLTRRVAGDDRISIIGSRERPGSATLAAAAMLNSFAEVEVGSLETEVDLYRFELSHLATRMWPKFERELIDAAGDRLPPACARCEGFSGGGCIDKGTYIVNNTAADVLDDENFEAIVEALDRFDEPYHWVSPREIPNYSPAQRYRATRAICIPNEGWVNPRIMMEKLDAIVARCGQVSFVDSSAKRLLGTSKGVEGVVLEDGRVLKGDRFLLATGATTTDLLAASEILLPVQRVFYGVGVSLEIRSPGFPHTKCVRTPNRGLACGVYSVPYFTLPDAPNDHILIGASNFISPAPYLHGRLTSVEALMRAAIEQINTNFYRADLVRVNVGWRPTTVDTYPLIGRCSVPNLVIATGTKRDGFHLSPLLSSVLAAILHDEAVDPRFSVFAPERAPIRSLTRAVAIERGARHLMSAAYQHGFSPSAGQMSAQVLQMFQDDLERLHDKVGARDWGIPPEMIDMYRYGNIS